jgi:hypothetical protein
MPNHFLTIGLCSRQDDMDLSPLKDANLCELVDPTWGLQWGTYDTKIHELGGDGSPILIEFQSAWGPPNPELMRKITDYLCKTYNLKEIAWIGHNPYDRSIGEIAVAEQEAQCSS